MAVMAARQEGALSTGFNVRPPAYCEMQEDSAIRAGPGAGAAVPPDWGDGHVVSTHLR